MYFSSEYSADFPRLVNLTGRSGQHNTRYSSEHHVDFTITQCECDQGSGSKHSAPPAFGYNAMQEWNAIVAACLLTRFCCSADCLAIFGSVRQQTAVYAFDVSLHVHSYDALRVYCSYTVLFSTAAKGCAQMHVMSGLKSLCIILYSDRLLYCKPEHAKSNIAYTVVLIADTTTLSTKILSMKGRRLSGTQ